MLFRSREVEMTTEQKNAYKDMLDKLLAEYDGGQVLAVNEAVKANKLVQIACGVDYGNNGEHITIPSQPRVDVLREIIEESEGKVLVFVPLTGVLEHLVSELSKEWDVAGIHGGTSKAERDQIFVTFQNTPAIRVIVANPATMSHGLTLTAATTIVWYAPIHSKIGRAHV